MRKRYAKGRTKEPKTRAQALFIARVKALLDEKGMSENSLAAIRGAPPQRTINDAMRGADPRLSTVVGIASALGLQAWQLVYEEQPLANVLQFPPYLPLGIGLKDKPGSGLPLVGKKKSK